MVLLALPPADHLLIERERGQFVPSRRRRMMANARAERLLKIPAAAYPRRCSSNASGLPGRNSARILGIRASFQRDNLRRHFGVRVLSRQPRSRVSVARLSRSWALRAAPFALTGAHVGQSGLTDPGDRSANKSRVSWPLRQGLRTRPVAPPSQQRSNVESRGSGRLQCNCIRKVSPTRKRCPCVLPVQFRRSAGAFTRARSSEG